MYSRDCVRATRSQPTNDVREDQLTVPFRRRVFEFPARNRPILGSFTAVRASISCPLDTHVRGLHMSIATYTAPALASAFLPRTSVTRLRSFTRATSHSRWTAKNRVLRSVDWCRDLGTDLSHLAGRTVPGQRHFADHGVYLCSITGYLTIARSLES